MNKRQAKKNKKCCIISNGETIYIFEREWRMRNKEFERKALEYRRKNKNGI